MPRQVDVERQTVLKQRVAPSQQAELRSEIAAALRKTWEEKSRADPSLTQELVGQVLGLSKSGVNHLFSGRSPLGLGHARALAQLLQVDIRSIVTPGDAINALEESMTMSTPSGYLAESVLQRAWTIVKADYAFKNEDFKFALAQAAAKALVGHSTVTDSDIMEAIRRYLADHSSIGTTA